MKYEIFWKSLKYDATEHCTIDQSFESNNVQGNIVGNHNANLFEVDYQLITDINWRINILDIVCRSNEIVRQWQLKKLNGGWLINDIWTPDLKECIDIDISLTPFTNTLPIRRLNFTDQPRHSIEVVYLNILTGEISKSRQHYTKISDRLYLYENDTRAFHAQLHIDDHCFVTEYEELFVRTNPVEQ